MSYNISKEYEITNDGKVIIDGVNIVQTGGEYPIVTIDKKPYFVHRLVADKYIPNKENKPQVNHIDGNKHNNNIDNLEWVTISENIKHAWDNGLAKPDGLVKARRKLTPEQVVEIRRRYVFRCNINGAKALAKEFNVSQSLISNIVNNKERIKHEHIS